MLTPVRLLAILALILALASFFVPSVPLLMIAVILLAVIHLL